MKKFLFHLALFFWFFTSFSQSIDYAYATISPNFKENANAVIRLRQKDVSITSRKSMTILTKDIVTVLNEKGQSHMGASEYFDNSTRIKSIEAIILNAFGKEIKRIKRKDFKEVSVSEGSIITDNKMLYLDYTPTEYPFTIIFQSEIESSNTAFIHTWFPVQDFYESIEKSVINIDCIPELGFKYKENNIQGNANIVKEDRSNGVLFTASGLMALKDEDYSPSFDAYAPNVMMGLNLFYLEGVEGNAKSWSEMGKWFSDKILVGTSELPEETKAKIKNLVGDEKNPIKKAKIVYKYVQEKTRYISIQEGIGGWKPMLAKNVDRLGYGDCKALTNYTKALLDVVDVPSYYVRLYGDRHKRNVVSDFVSMQSNHVILGIPDNGKYIWLECTSQTLPFGFQGDFTDDRTALVLKPDGGEIVRTEIYEATNNTQYSAGNYSVTENGAILGKIVIKSKGIPYDNKSSLDGRSSDDLKKIYKNYFNNINNLKFNKINIVNDKDLVEFTEEIALESSQYANKSGNRLIFALNAYNLSSTVPARYRNRTNPFEISRGFYDYDEITIDLPKGFIIEAKPENFELKDKFGYYKVEYFMINESQVLYKRTYQLNSGYFDKSEYESFRKFREQIAKNDNAKIVLAKI